MGSPKLSFMQIVMMWDSRESYTRKMLLNVRLINELIINQGCLSPGALWINEQMEGFDFKKLRKSIMKYSQAGYSHIMRDDITGKMFRVKDDGAPDLDEEEA
ncbi:hypothetical protein Hanom_Chr10g00906311 [Helianthus anomalus]